MMLHRIGTWAGRAVLTLAVAGLFSAGAQAGRPPGWGHGKVRVTTVYVDVQGGHRLRKSVARHVRHHAGPGVRLVRHRYDADVVARVDLRLRGVQYRQIRGHRAYRGPRGPHVHAALPYRYGVSLHPRGDGGRPFVAHRFRGCAETRVPVRHRYTHRAARDQVYNRVARTIARDVVRLSARADRHPRSYGHRPKGHPHGRPWASR